MRTQHYAFGCCSIDLKTAVEAPALIAYHGLVVIWMIALSWSLPFSLHWRPYNVCGGDSLICWGYVHSEITFHTDSSVLLVMHYQYWLYMTNSGLFIWSAFTTVVSSSPLTMIALSVLLVQSKGATSMAIIDIHQTATSRPYLSVLLTVSGL